MTPQGFRDLLVWGNARTLAPFSTEAIEDLLVRHADFLPIITRGDDALAVLSLPSETFDGVACQLVVFIVKPSVNALEFLEDVKDAARRMGATRLMGVTHRLKIHPATERLIARYGAVPDGTVLTWRLD